MLNVWTQPSGYNLGTREERRSVDLTLPTIEDITGITFTLISGALPKGLRIAANKIVGATLEVSRDTVSTFVIRASNGVEISDRTFTLSVTGPDAPIWVTPGKNPDLQVRDYDPITEYAIGEIVRYGDTMYSVIAVTTGHTPPNNTYYRLYTEQNNALAVGPSTTRSVTLTSASRTGNIVTATTSVPHDFIFGNSVSVYTSIASLNGDSVEILRQNPLPGETADQYYTRIANSIAYKRSGVNLTSTAITGNVVLNNPATTFILDNSYIDFQLQAVDTDLTSGDTLEYFIADDDGELPPGISMDSKGRITGVIDPILSLDITARTGFFDTNLFDSYAYDFGEAPNIGIEDFLNVVTPKKLNRNYSFIVSVSDGETVVRREFRIFVVGDDFLRTDNMVMQVGTGSFTADATYLRSVIWLAASNLGIKRANNYVTIKLEYFDPNPAIGPIEFTLDAVNDDLSVSKLPDGLFLDSATGEIFGFIPYQPAITESFKFTIDAKKYDKENLTEVEVQIVVLEDAPYGQNFLKIGTLPEEDVSLIIGDTIRIGPTVYTIVNYQAPLNNSSRATLNLKENLITDVFDGYIISQTYFQSSAFVTQSSKKTFFMNVLGEIDSVINFTTDSNLGVIKANFPSLLTVQATTTVPNATLGYTITEGVLPSGLTLSTSGDIVGKINQFRANSISGFTLFDTNATTFDNEAMTIDRSYTFTVKAQDQFRFSATTKQFTLTVNGGELTLYSNIYTKPFPKLEKRELFYNFINDTTVFTPDKIYRLGDPEYGVQSDLKMLIYPGIESVAIANYVAALSKNTRRKRMKLGSVKKAIAKYQGTNDIVYEVIYVEAFDEYENSNGSAAAKYKLADNTQSPVKVNQNHASTYDGKLGTVNNETGQVTYENATVNKLLNEQAFDRFRPVDVPYSADSKNLKISGNNLEYVYPSNIANIRKNIAEVGLTENEFLPLWMTTPQNARTAATGFVKAIPLCYCNPGEGDYILQNINNKNFDFSQLDYEIDRFIIDSDLNSVGEQYLKFANFKFNI